jgi:hypothetical protein
MSGFKRVSGSPGHASFTMVLTTMNVLASCVSNPEVQDASLHITPSSAFQTFDPIQSQALSYIA